MISSQIGELQRPNCALIVAYARMPLPVKAELLKFFFEEFKISKLCLLPKALAVCQLAEMRTGIVVDSGATCTYVWVVVDGRVDDSDEVADFDDEAKDIGSDD